MNLRELSSPVQYTHFAHMYISVRLSVCLAVWILWLVDPAISAGQYLFYTLCTGTSNASGDPAYLLESFFLVEIYWKFAKSPGNCLTAFDCLSLT